jgi:hypothetical protein
VAAAAVIVFASGGGAAIPLTPASQAQTPGHDLSAQVARNKNHLLEALPSVDPDARETRIISATQDYPREEKAWDVITIAVEFRDSVGPGAFNVSIRGKISTRSNAVPTIDELCDGNDCQRLPQPDGSTVVITTSKVVGTDMPANITVHPVPGTGPLTRLVVGPSRDATHFRKDGTSVYIFNSDFIYGDLADHYGGRSGTRAKFPLSDQQLVALVTDPAFNVG